jgi:hypothetical protein
MIGAKTGLPFWFWSRSQSRLVLREVWGDAELGTRFVRLCSLVGALVLSIGTFVPAHADTTGTVSVTGSIIASPLSMTIDQTSVGFGDINAAGTAQSPVAAIGYRGSNGAFWVSETSIQITVSSPSGWNGFVCQNAGGTLPPGGIAIAKTTKPSSLADATSAYSTGLTSTGCPGSLSWGSGGSSGPQVNSIYFLTKVLDTDPASGFFNPTLKFTVSPV